MKSLVIAVINYSNEEEVITYAKMIANQTIARNISLVIVNNQKSHNPKIDLIEEIRKIELSIQVYDPKENLGYLNGALYGCRQFIEEEEYVPEWVVISNTDIEILDNSFFEKFILKDYEKDIWCVAPSVFSPNKNSYDNPHYLNKCSLKKINRLIWIHEHPIIADFYSKLANLKAKFTKNIKKESQYVYSAHGCFFVLKNEFLEKIRNNWYGGFFYSEEAYIAENLLINKRKCFYDASLEVIHNENSVTGLLGMKKKSKYIANSLKYIRNEFYKS